MLLASALIKQLAKASFPLFRIFSLQKQFLNN